MPDYKNNLTIALEKLSEFCQRWQVAELALFGSALQDAFNIDSDIGI
jgi:hypothetical protein